jgi:hypothetical protein
MRQRLGGNNLELILIILIGIMLIFAGVAFYLSHTGLRSNADKTIFIGAIFTVLMLGLSSCIVGYINSTMVFRYPLPGGQGWSNRQWVYVSTVVAVLVVTMFTPAMLRRNTVKILERMEREEFNKRKNTNTPKYCPVERASFV